MATTSIAEKLAKLEKKIEKRKSDIAELTEKLKEELAEYDKLYLTALADKYKLILVRFHFTYLLRSFHNLTGNSNQSQAF